MISGNAVSGGTTAGRTAAGGSGIRFADNLGMDIENCEQTTGTNEQRLRMEKLARDIIRLSRNTLLVNLRFLDSALSQFEPVVFDGTYATEGKMFAFGPEHVLTSYKEERNAPVRDYLHVVLHCVFQHMYIHSEVDPFCWDLACDMAVEYTINGLGLAAADCRRAVRQQLILEGIQQSVGTMTAEKIYRYYLNKKLPPETLDEIRSLFYADNHFMWYRDDESRQTEDKENKEQKSKTEQRRHDNNSEEQQDRQRRNRPSETQEQVWKNISQRMQTDLETFSRQQGDRAGGLMQNLSRVNRESYDYTTFLKKFSVMGEVMKINDDEFDYIFYTYGLKLYKNLPLVEPLEYKEVKKIKEFVIAIDTSASVSGALVQAFVQKTYNILKSTESYFRKINLHIIQCDADIQEDVKITSQEEFDEYISRMEIRGLGGTDYRPVFRYVDQLVQAKEFTNLKGLIYFTDGYGTFPSRKPDYDTAFVFVEEDAERPAVPPWAIRLMLPLEELEEMQEEAGSI